MLATLSELQDHKITPEKAYDKIYKKIKPRRIPLSKRAHFIKLSIKIPEEKGVTTFLKVLFFFPFPIMLLRVILGFVRMEKYVDDLPLTKREIINLIAHKGVKVKVNTKSGEKILIKTI